MKEMAVLGHAMQVARGEAKPKVDVVVLDAPATGHGMSLLWAPLLVSEVLGKGPLGRLAGEVADLVRDPEQVAVVIATTAEEMPVQEALELIAGLRERLGRPPELLVVNGLYPPFPEHPGRVAAGVKAALALWRQRRAVNERELTRLATTWQGPRVDLPLLAVERGPALVTALGSHLARALEPAELP
jgi:anion-transporting  ArsA/GET3 family ATPase